MEERAIDIRTSWEYQKGYAIGMREGYIKAQELYSKALIDAIGSQPPPKIIVTTKEGLENIKKNGLGGCLE